MHDSPTKEEAIAWHREWMRDMVGIDTTTMDSVMQVIQEIYQ